MSLHLTPAMLEAAYELLRATPPFNKWRLPEADDVEFHVTIIKNAMADYHYSHCLGDPQIHKIRVHAKRHPTLRELLESMAHEMVHIYQRGTVDHVVKRRSAVHGPKFKRLAAQVCRYHGFDAATF